MRGLVQRVVRAEVRSRASADAGWQVSGSIGAGLCVFVGVTHDDGPAGADKLANKIWGLRILDDAAGVMNRSLSDVHADGDTAEVLIVSQFTLYGDARKGRRPSWIEAARPEHAEPLVDRAVDVLRSMGATVATGVFRTEMEVDLTNDGPVTLMLEV
jgi:D-tyrosyl-tRNA(Tyr) deacylase